MKRSLPAKWRVSAIYNLVSPVAVAVLMVLFADAPSIERLEGLTMDLRFRARESTQSATDPRLVLVGIDEPSLSRFGRWPWPRKIHGDLCRVLAASNAAVVAFDILFTEPGRPEDDADFVEGARALPNLVSGATTVSADESIPSAMGRTKPLSRIRGDRSAIQGGSGALVPIPALGEISLTGFADSDPSGIDGIRRRIPLVVRVGDDIFPSLALQTLILYWRVPIDEIDVRLGEWIELPTPEGTRRIPITSSGELWVNYRAEGSYAYRSYESLLGATSQKQGLSPAPQNAATAKASDLGGRIVVVAQVALGLTDLGPSPLESVSPLALVSMSAMNSMLTNDYIRVVRLWPWPLVIWLAIAWATLIWPQNRRIMRTLLLPLGVILLFTGLAFVLFARMGLAIPVVVPILGFAIIYVGKICVSWVDEVVANRRFSFLYDLISPAARPSLIYDLVAPLVVAVLMAFGANYSLMQSLENISIDLRFRARAPRDPPADPRLLLVAIDEGSLDLFGAWPWPRERHADLCKLLAVNDPSVVTFDLLFTEPKVKEDDAYLAESAQSLPSLVTGAHTDGNMGPVPEGVIRTQPIRSIVGPKDAIHGKSGARVPFPALGAASWTGFVDSDPSGTDGVRRRIPLLVRVGGDVYPSLALQTLMLHWKVQSRDINVRLGQYIEVPCPEGRRRIPITSSGELWLNYRAKEGFGYWPYHALMEALYRDATGEKPLPKDKPGVKDKIVVIGQWAAGLTDLGPSPLEPSSPLVLTSMNALNSILRNDYLRVVPLAPGILIGWVVIAWSTLVGLRNEHILRSLLLPVAIISLYIGAAFALFTLNSIAIPVALPVLAFALIHVGKVSIEWIEEVFAERRVSAELARVTEARKLLEQELSIAREIQMSTLPQVFPPFPERAEIDLHAIMIPAKYVGGDLYEFFFVGENKLFFVIGDVSGKGVPAALFMTMALAVIRSHVIAGRSPSETLRRSNNVLALRNERCTFVTIFCGLLDTETGVVRYSNGGHNPPVLMDGEGGVKFLEAEGTAIGAIEGLEFEERELTLQPDQGIFLYTDGVTEAIDEKEELFTDDRLLEALNIRHRAFNAEQIIGRVNRQLTKFVGGAQQFDDITALALFYRGKSNGAEIAAADGANDRT